MLLVMEQKPIVSCHEEVLGTELSSSYLTLGCWWEPPFTLASVLGFGSAAVNQRGIW